TVREATVEGKRLPRGVYTSSGGWLQGRGYVIVGNVKQVATSGVVDDPEQAIGINNIAVFKSAVTFKLPDGACSVTAVTGGFLLTIVPRGGNARFDGFITGSGSVRIEASRDRPLQIAGAPSNSYQGTTTLTRGVLKLRKPGQAMAIPGDLVI